MKNINKFIYMCTVMLLSITTLQAEEQSPKIDYVEVDHIVNYNGHEIEVLRPVRMETKTTKSDDSNKNRENDNYVEVDKIVNINGRKIEVLRPIKVQVSTTYSKDRENSTEEKALAEKAQLKAEAEAKAKEEAARKAAEALAAKEAAQAKAYTEAKEKLAAQKLAEEKAQREAAQRALVEKALAEKAQLKAEAEAKAKEEAARKAAEALIAEAKRKAYNDAKAKLAAAKVQRETETLQDEKIKKLEKEFSDMFTLTRISFKTGSDRLTGKSKVLLNKVTKMIKGHSGLKYFIEGHTDSRGDEKLNKWLSQKRAERVQNYLVSKGISVEILSGKGFGSEKPIASNKTKFGRLKNRRVTFKIMKR
jgi:TolA protein